MPRGCCRTPRTTGGVGGYRQRARCAIHFWCVQISRPRDAAHLPADARNQRLVPDLGYDEERLARGFGFHVLVAGHHVVPFHLVFWVQSVQLVGRLDNFGGNGAWLTSGETIHGVNKARVSVAGGRVVVLVAVAMRRGTAGAVAWDQPWVSVHVVGALALWRGGAGAGSRRRRAGSQAAVLH